MFRSYVDHIGNISYDYSGGGVFYPFIKVGKDTVLPHLMVYAADSIEFYKGNVYLNKKLLPLRQDKSSFVNYSKPMSYFKKITPIVNLLDSKKKMKTLAKIKEGDIIYFIPEYYTGGTDFKMTPVGLMPGGIANYAILNSILNNSWLKAAKFPLLYLLLGATFGAVIALNTSAVISFIGLICGLSFGVGLLPLPFLLSFYSYAFNASSRRPLWQLSSGFLLRELGKKIKSRDLFIKLLRGCKA